MSLIRLLLVLSLLVAALQGQAQEGPAAARVNGVEISQSRFEHYFTDYLQAQGRAVASIRSPTLYKRLRRAALDDLIDKELLWQAAQQAGLVIDDQAVAASLAAFRAAFPSEEVFIRRLSDAGFDEADFNQYLRQELASQRMLAELSQVSSPPDSDVRAFYQANKSLIEQSAAPRSAPSEVNESVRTASGWHLIKEQNDATRAQVEDSQGLAIAKRVLESRLQAQASEDALKRLRAQNKIERAYGQ